MSKTALRNLLPSCIVLIVGCGALWAATDGLRALTEESARRLSAARDRAKLPAIELEDMNGDPLRIGQAQSAKTTLVGFIYTTCPTICQAAGSDFARIRNRLKELRLHRHVRLVSVSFDPARDDPPQMRLYGEQHGADGTIWTIARPRSDALRAITTSFGVRIIPDQWGGYQHNAAVHVVDRAGRLTGIFGTGDLEGILNAVRGAT
jgi:protein SCO1/2